jgi:signal transduction histidine kinase
MRHLLPSGHQRRAEAEAIGDLRHQARVLRLPFVAALIVFVVAVSSTQLALRLENREADRQTERLARVYFDGLEASTRSSIRSRDWGAVEARFRLAFTAQEGLVEVGLFTLDADGQVQARAFFAEVIAVPAVIASGRQTFLIDEVTGLAWASRAVATAEGFRLVAALDIRDLLSARQRLFWTIAVIDLLVAALCGFAAYLALRRLGRPVDALLALLKDGARRPEPIPPQLAARADKDLQPVLVAYNAMVEGLRDRDRLRAEIAERSQAAALGRLAATLAHEVRNPLGGLSTAVTTLRKYGSDPAVREESLAFLARGIDSLDSLVTRTLNVYRPREERRLCREDFDDIGLLATPAALKHEVELKIVLDLPQTFDVAASGVRQVLLNLVLNAVAVSPPGGCVTLDARIEAGHLVCRVSDEGPGMEHHHIRRLLGEAAADAGSRRIGIDAVVAILGDLEARASVQGGEGGGTTIRVDIPVEALS